MWKAFNIGGIVLVAALMTNAPSAKARQVPPDKACPAGVTFQQCYDRCLARGGVGISSPEAGCAKRCQKRGCQ